MKTNRSDGQGPTSLLRPGIYARTTPFSKCHPDPASHTLIVMTNTGKTNTEPSGKVTIVFLKCDKVPEKAKEAHGEYQDVLHNLFEPMMPKDRKLELETLSYDVVHKREYPKDDVLARTDAVVVSGSFEDEAHADTMWILKLAGFLIKIHVSVHYGENDGNTDRSSRCAG